jgi:hypothetical protein
MTNSNRNPSNPNYVPEVGRLATGRYDFQSHVDGTGFRQQANTIDLFPTLIISSVTYTNVQDILAVLAANSNPPSIPNATNTSVGLIQLGGDISGNNSAISPKVSGLQGYPVSTAPPTGGYVLTWNGTTWSPQPPPNYSLGGDLSGITSSATVTRMQGYPISSTPPLTNQLLGWSGSSWNPTSYITIPNDGYLTVDGYLMVNSDAYATFDGDATFNNDAIFNSGATFNSTITTNTVIVNDNLVLNAQFNMSGGTTNFICNPANFTMTVPSGGDLICNSGSLAVLEGTADLIGTTNVSGTFNMGTNITFGATVGSPTISQAETSGANNTLSIVAQFNSSNAVGGNLVLSSGGGTSSTGNVYLQLGGNAAVTIAPSSFTLTGLSLALASDSISVAGSAGSTLTIGSGVSVVYLKLTSLWDSSFTLVFPNQNAYYNVVVTYPSIGSGATLSFKTASTTITAYTFSSSAPPSDGTWVQTDGAGNIYSGWHNYTT